MESLNKALAPLADLTDIISGEDYVTVSYVRSLLHHIYTEALAMRSDYTRLTKHIKEKIKSCLTEKYFENAEAMMLLDKVTMLDPRLKANYICVSHLTTVKDEIIAEALNEEEVLNKSRPKEAASLGSESSLIPRQKISCEMERYLQAPQLDADDDPLLWWMSNQQMFPVLALMAKKYLCICASSSASERTFSNSGNIITSKRTCLKPTKVNMLTFLSKNL